MAEIGAKEIADMMGRCNQYPGYTGMAVFSKAERKRRFVQEMCGWADCGQLPDVEAITRYGHIKFKNGSVIRVTSSEENTVRGLKANEVIFDEVPAETMDMVRSNLFPFVINGEELEVRESYEGKELDDFLQGFTII